MKKSRRRLLETLVLVLIATVAVLAEAPLESRGITRDISAVVILVLFFTGLVLYRIIYLKQALGKAYLLFSAPVALIAAFVALRETGLLVLPSPAIWLGGAILFILAGAVIHALGYGSLSDRKPEAN
jgi:hypothetical protein